MHEDVDVDQARAHERGRRELGGAQLDRRQLLRGLAGLGGLGPAALVACGGPAPLGEELWLSAAGDDEATFGLGVFAPASGRSEAVRTGFRGHGLAVHPGRPWVVLAERRPGTRAALVDVAERRVLRELHAPRGRVLQGHAIFSRDGARVLATEADARTGAGSVGVWRVADGARLGALSTSGIGPHELLLLADGRTLAVANGGILTRPETGREKLNLDTMASSLVYLDIETGAVLDEARVAEEKASIRHLAAFSDGRVAFGAQLQREAAGHARPVPLCGLHRRGEAPVLLDEGLALAARLEDYVGSVAASDAAGLAAFTSPRGNIALFFDARTGRLAGHLELVDVCGVSARGEGFGVSSSVGLLAEVRGASIARRRDADLRWDNHLLIRRPA